LMDTIPGAELERQVAKILEGIPGIQEMEAIHVHRFGPYLTMNLTIAVDGSIPVAQGDRIASIAEDELRRAIDFLQVVHIHYHPAQARPY
jgi:divalent metal cation (Fe/Co/Zn/Cd) transporter